MILLILHSKWVGSCWKLKFQPWRGRTEQTNPSNQERSVGCSHVIMPLRSALVHNIGGLLKRSPHARQCLCQSSPKTIVKRKAKTSTRGDASSSADASNAVQMCIDMAKYGNGNSLLMLCPDSIVESAIQRKQQMR